MLLRKPDSSGLRRQVDALPGDVVFPAVIGAAQAAFLVLAEPERDAAMRAEFVDQPDAALAVAESRPDFRPSAWRAPAGSPARGFRSPAGTAPSSAAAAGPSACRARRGSTGRFVHATSWRRFLGRLLCLAAIIGGLAVQGSRTPCRCRASPLQRETRPGSARKSRSRPRSMRACGRRAGLCWSAIRRRSRCMPAPPGLRPTERDRRSGRGRLGKRRGQFARRARGRQRAGRIRQGRRSLRPRLACQRPARHQGGAGRRGRSGGGGAADRALDRRRRHPFRRLSVVRRARDRHAGRGRLSDDLLRRRRASCTRPCI